ncbi:hypothetical protein RhiirA4_410151, partial [Rhizophagus irregularis]
MILLYNVIKIMGQHLAVVVVGLTYFKIEMENGKAILHTLILILIYQKVMMEHIIIFL